jgi:hypothetical protein
LQPIEIARIEMRWNVNIATLAHCSLNKLAERAEAFLLCDEESDLDLSIRDCTAEVELYLTFLHAGGCAISSGKVFAGTPLLARKADGTKAMSEIGSKSFNASYGSLLYRNGFITSVPSIAIRSV